MFITSEKLIINFILIFTFCFFIINPANSEDVSTEPQIQENLQTQQGLKVHVDPDTGELISRPEEGVNEDDANVVQPNNVIINNTPHEEAVMIENPDGSKTFYPPDSYVFTNNAKIDENGNIITECGREHE